MTSPPAGLSSDHIDVNLASSSSPPPIPFDQWSDAHDTIETDDERDIQETIQRGDSEDLTLRVDKISAPDKMHDIGTPSPTNLEPNAEERASDADATSVHSMPVVQVTEPSSPASTAPLTAPSASSRFPPSPSTNLAPPSPALQQSRRNRNRSALIDNRASNRLSGFLSSLIHRRDHTPSSIAEASASASSVPHSSSRGSSPAPSRPSTPPPRLSPPSLNDLGLTLSSLTTHLLPSNSSTPPSSGVFLSPHYLLLCHAQGLDVLPLLTPPAPQPYALVRRVPFKSVVIMEHRGVLVAIAGRRNGVRVYALEEVKRAVEWRIDVEVRREQDRARREEAKRGPVSAVSALHRDIEKKLVAGKISEKASTSPVVNGGKSNQARRSSVSVVPPVSALTRSRTQLNKRPRTAESPTEPPAIRAPACSPMGPPPAYTNPSPSSRPVDPPSAISLTPSRSRATSLNEVLAGSLSRRHTGDFHIDRDDDQNDDSKADWSSSDDEAINVMSAPSGSQALDERTSSMGAATGASIASGGNTRMEVNRAQTAPLLQRRNRPADLDLSSARANSRADVAPSPPPSPTPTLITLRQALTLSPQNGGTLSRRGSAVDAAEPNAGVDADADGEADAEADEEEDVDGFPSSPTTPTRERISLAEALMESRMPELPPAGSLRPQEAILIGARNGAGNDEVPASPRTSDSHTTYTNTRRSTGDQSSRRRRRWSVLGGVFSHSPANSQSSIPSLPECATLEAASSPLGGADPAMRERTASQLTRSQSSRIAPSASSATVRPPSRPSTSPGPSTLRDLPSTSNDQPPLPTLPPASTSHNRFLPRIITNAFQSRRSDDQSALPRTGDSDAKRAMAIPMAPPAPPPKLEYVKLPGTKGAVMIKAVETPKKSFLAILCGENGEKVELFAGTYRTALGLSRTFILPDSPRSLELQLQGDDLVEVFLVFSQNVFGLEPATVRVREVRIGRAERRAARRRARENRTDQQTPDADAEGADAGAGDEETAVNVTILAPSSPVAVEDGTPSTPSPLPNLSQAPSHPSDPPQTQTECSSMAANSTDELVTVAAAQASPYTTFQQLSFAPNFPLATIADEYVIPPTYPSFLEYRSTYEPEVNGSSNVDLSQVQFSPPGLPVPVPGPPSKWFYRDPKGIVHGPWKAALMQAWYKDGLLPPDLPVRREEDAEYILLKDLRLQCVNPTHPFRSAPPPPSAPEQLITDVSKPLLSPISLLSQPKRFGPPALFYSSRGGHSTAIVDARGRSVLKGRFLWSSDDQDDYPPSTVKLGDVKRLEAFDVADRAVLVAMRQGGLEVVDFGDALLRPADYSRTMYPNFQPPSSSISRRGPFVWKIGTPLSHQSSSSSLSSVGFIPSKSTNAGPRKKQSTGPAKSPGRSDYSYAGEVDSDRLQDEVLFLGRKDDELYLCERRTSSFRILRLSPSIS
ncbi:hypothetical protein AcW2_001002 [Taiwanofungus camphoratus]|nr:hypothetical protein AcW2_001002 [Antrodia cinnamomea]